MNTFTQPAIIVLISERMVPLKAFIHFTAMLVHLFVTMSALLLIHSFVGAVTYMCGFFFAFRIDIKYKYMVLLFARIVLVCLSVGILFFT